MRMNGGAHLDVASSGGITQLNRVVDMVNSRHTPEEIKQWCEREIARLRNLKDAT